MSNLPVLIECITLYISEDVPENLPYFKFIWLLCSRAYDLLWPLKTAKNEVEKKKSIDYKGMSNEGWKNIFCAGCALCCFCKLVPESSVAFFHGIISAYLFGYATFLYAMYMYMYNLEYACLICVGYTLANFDVKNKNSFLQFGVCSCVYFFVSENNMLLWKNRTDRWIWLFWLNVISSLLSSASFIAIFESQFFIQKKNRKNKKTNFVFFYFNGIFGVDDVQ